MFNDTGEEMMRPFLPYYAFLIGANPVLFGLLLSIEEAGNRIFKFFTGTLSDMWGRKSPISLGYIFIVFYRIGISASRSFTHLIPPVTLRQLGRSLRDPAREALIAECIIPEKRGRAFGILNAVDTIGSVCGPALGIFLLSLFTFGSDLKFITDAIFTSLTNPQKIASQFNDLNSYRSLFIISAIPTLISALIITIFLKETLKKRDLKNTFPSYFSKLKQGMTLYNANKQLKVYTFGNMLFSFGAVPILMIIAYITTPVSKRGLGETVITGGILFIFYSFILFLSSYPAGMLSDRLGRKSSQIFADVTCVLYLLSVFMLASTKYKLFLFLSFFLYGIFESLWITSRRAVIADLAPADARAQALGTFSMLYGFSLIASPLIFGALWNFFSIQIACLVSISICVLSAIFLSFLAKETGSL